MKELTTPFGNDMFAIVWDVFKKLYPEKKCECFWVDNIVDERGKTAYGETVFDENGYVFVYVSALAPVHHATEIFAHELAHVAAGKENDHNMAWEYAFTRIHEEYAKAIAEEIK